MALTTTAMRQTSFQKDYDIETRFTRQIKAILGNYFFRKDVAADLHEGTDFLVYEAGRVRVAVRLRRYSYWKNPQFRCEFTIRHSRPSGIKTEIHKIRVGLVDYMLYGFIDEPEQRILEYFISDLAIFRACDPEPLMVNENADGSSQFAVYGISQFPDAFILKRYRKDNDDTDT